MQASFPTHETSRHLERPHEGRMIAGVAVGLADYLGVDVALIRVALVVLAVCGGLGIPLYLAAWLFVPDECDKESVAERLLGHDDPGVGSSHPAHRCPDRPQQGTSAAAAAAAGQDPRRSDDAPPS